MPDFHFRLIDYWEQMQYKSVNRALTTPVLVTFEYFI